MITATENKSTLWPENSHVIPPFSFLKTFESDLCWPLSYSCKYRKTQCKNVVESDCFTSVNTLLIKTTHNGWGSLQCQMLYILHSAEQYFTFQSLNALFPNLTNSDGAQKPQKPGHMRRKWSQNAQQTSEIVPKSYKMSEVATYINLSIPKKSDQPINPSKML